MKGGAGVGNARVTRRGLLAAGAATLAAGALAGCGSTVARLTRAAAIPVVLTWCPWHGFPNGGSRAAVELLRQGIQPWLAQNPGVRVQIADLANTQAIVASLLAGNGPDIFEDSVLPPYTESALALDLQPYLRREGAAGRVFTSGQLVPLQAQTAGPAGVALYGLPAHTRTVALAVNRGAVDALGLTEPQPDWTYGQWENLWRQVTASSRPGTWGSALDWSGYDGSGGNPAPFYLKGFGGEYVDPADPTQAWLDQSGSLDALNWAYGLVRDGVCVATSETDVESEFASGRLVSGPLGTTGGLLTAAEHWNGLDWNLYPMPVWPKGRFTLGSGEFCAIWSGSRQQELAWSLVDYLCLGSRWQEYLIQLALIGPNQQRLWGAWQAQVAVQAPPLRAVDIGVFAQAVGQNELYSGLSFPFAEQQTTQILAAFGQQVMNGVSVASAASAAAKRINAVQATYAQAEAAGQAAQADLQKWASSGTASGSTAG